MILFASDFGHAGPYVGQVHAVLARQAPGVPVIDLMHDLPAFRPAAAGCLIRQIIRSMVPAATAAPVYESKSAGDIVLAVVDPGVGTARRAVALETDWGYFVGPDNGLLAPAVALIGGAGRAHLIANEELVIPSAGATFDGRDRFGPAAAVLASGQAGIEDIGPAVPVGSLTPSMLPLPAVETERVSGVAWWVDRFGNVQTNVGPDELASLGIGIGTEMTVRIGPAEHVLPLVAAFGDVEPGEGMVVIDSQGLAALAVRDGRADEKLRLGEGRSVVFEPIRR